jgi:hypothetical protein
MVCYQLHQGGNPRPEESRNRLPEPASFSLGRTPGFEPGSPAEQAKEHSDSTTTDEWRDRNTIEAAPVSGAPSCSLCPGVSVAELPPTGFEPAKAERCNASTRRSPTIAVTGRLPERARCQEESVTRTYDRPVAYRWDSNPEGPFEGTP